MRGSLIHGQAYDRSHSLPRFYVPLINTTFGASQSFKGSVYVYVDDHGTSSEPSSPISRTPLAFLDPL